MLFGGKPRRLDITQLMLWSLSSSPPSDWFEDNSKTAVPDSPQLSPKDVILNLESKFQIYEECLQREVPFR